ncbi:MAG: MBL fold metallo-hydrolase [Aquisalimonadaceae bacterium]
MGGPVKERAEFASRCEPDILFDGQEVLLGNIEVIPTPGHTSGSTCFLVESTHSKRYLFTGDTLFRGKDGSWEAGYIPGYSDKAPLIESLKLLQEIKPNIVLSSGSEQDIGFEEIVPEDWGGHVERALSNLLKAKRQQTKEKRLS